MTPANEHALAHCIGEIQPAQARLDEAEARLKATDGDGDSNDAMLDVFNSLKATLADDSASLNERLRRVFAEFQIQLAEDGETILVLPVLLPDVIEAHGGRPGTIGVIERDTYTAMQDETASADAPILLIVPPPVRGISIDTRPAARLSVSR